MEIRQLEKQYKIKSTVFIIALTAYSTEMFSKKCFDVGMDAFMTKPVCSEKIKDILKKKLW